MNNFGEYGWIQRKEDEEVTKDQQQHQQKSQNKKNASAGKVNQSDNHSTIHLRNSKATTTTSIKSKLLKKGTSGRQEKTKKRKQVFDLNECR